GSGWRVEALGGFRYLGMDDLLQVHAVLTTNGGGDTYDRFATANNFYGGQVGVRLTGDLGRLRPALGTKLALRATQEELDGAGNAILPEGAVPPGGAPQLPGGFYTAATNMGRSTQTHFAVVSETNLSVAVRLSDRVSVTGGYSFLYWSNVLRTG